MSGATAPILHGTTATAAAAFFPKPKPLKTFSCPEFTAPNLVRSGQFVSRKPISWDSRTWRPNTMVESTDACAFRSRNGDEGVGAFEREAFVQGSPGFRPSVVVDGFEATLNRMSKWIVASLFGAVFLWRHDAQALWAAMGSVLNAGLSTILKQILNQERPTSTLRSDPGMPSSHAQSIFFAVVFVILSMVEWLGLNALTIALSGVALAVGSYFSWLRVSQQLHTVSQVIVGILIGTLFSTLWFWSWEAIILKAFISHLWVRIVVALGASGLCLGFFLYVIRYWVIDEN